MNKIDTPEKLQNAFEQLGALAAHLRAAIRASVVLKCEDLGEGNLDIELADLAANLADDLCKVLANCDVSAMKLIRTDDEISR